MTRSRRRRVCYSNVDVVRLPQWFCSEEQILTEAERAEYVGRYRARKAA